MSNVEITSVTFLSSKCYRCKEPWKHVVYAEGIEAPLYFCDECLEYIKNRWKRPFRVVTSAPNVVYRSKTHKQERSKINA